MSASKKHGYTFAEMLVVLAIIALMMAIVVPRLMFQQKGSGLKSAASEVMSALRTARRMAIAEREYRALALDIYSIPAEFVIMRARGSDDPAALDYVPIGEFQRLPENIAVVGVATTSGWSTLDVTRTDDIVLDNTEDGSAPPTIYNPQENNGLVNPIYRMIGFYPTGTADRAMIYLWNTTDERVPLPNPSTAQTRSNLTAIGQPPGLNVNNPSNQGQYFNVPTADSPEDAYYYTLVVNPLTGAVIVYDYAWGYGSPQWDRKKDGE